MQERLSMLLARVPRQRHQSRHRQGMKRLPAPLHQLAWHRQALQLPLLRAMASRGSRRNPIRPLLHPRRRKLWT